MNVQVLSRDRRCGSCLSPGVRGSHHCTVSDTLFPCNHHRSHPNFPSNHNPQSIFCLASLMKLHIFCQITPTIFPYCVVVGCLRSRNTDQNNTECMSLIRDGQHLGDLTTDLWAWKILFMVFWCCHVVNIFGIMCKVLVAHYHICIILLW